MKLIVGLGNPGPQYEVTPHNFGFLAVDRIAEQANATITNRRCRALTGKGRLEWKDAKGTRQGEDVLLAKPETFMNLSGLSVRELVVEAERADEEFMVKKDLIVLYDDLDFPLGTLRIRERGSSAGHNGIESVMNMLGTEEFIRIRLGISPEHAVRNSKEFVLTSWRKKELDIVADVLERTVDAVTVIMAEGISAAMNRFNRKEKEQSGSSS